MGSEDTAFTERSAPWMASVDGNWDDPAENDDNVGWVETPGPRSASSGPAPSTSTSSGSQASDTDVGVDSAHGKNLRRLSEIKAKYDPDNFFRRNNNITPAVLELVLRRRRCGAGAELREQVRHLEGAARRVDGTADPRFGLFAGLRRQHAERHGNPGVDRCQLEAAGGLPATKSKCGVSPRITQPSATTHENLRVFASAIAASGSSNAPGTGITVIDERATPSRRAPRAPARASAW